MATDREGVRVDVLLDEIGASHAFVDALARAELIRVEQDAEGAIVSFADAERVRVGFLLTAELEVNLAGVEVALHMRDTIFSLQRQFAELLAQLAAARRPPEG